MKKKFTLIIILLLLLLIKPYVNINYSDNIEEPEVIGSYSFGYYCSGSHSYVYCCLNGDRCQQCDYKHSGNCCYSHTYSYSYVSADGHTQSCQNCGGAWWQSHSSTACSCGNGNKCSLCGYMYGHSCHTHSYTSSYTNYNSTYHYAYCSCGDYSLVAHNTTTLSCGYKSCSNCTYTSGSHSYTNSYTSNNATTHTAKCKCGATESQNHTIPSLSCGYKACSYCTYSSGSHSYTNSYTSNNATTHTAKCKCGATESQNHTIPSLSCGYKKCSYCTYTSGSHSYTNSYTSNNATTHTAKCKCGATESQNHTIPSLSCGYKKCSYCTYSSGSHNYADATCEAPKTCSCGATTGSALGHTYTNGEIICNVDGSKDTQRCIRYGSGGCTATQPINCTHSITVTVQGENGTVTGSTTCKPGATVNISATANVGYSFKNWTTTGGTLTNANLASTTVKTSNTNITVTANFEINQYTLTINPNGGTWNSSTSNQEFVQNYNTTKIIDNALSLEKIVTFNGNGGTSTANSISSVKMFSRWILSGGGSFVGNTYTFTNNGTLTAEYVGGSITLPGATKEHYEITGWYTAASGGTKVGDPGDSYTPASDITLYAQWEKVTSKLTINPNGGSWAGSTSTQEVYQRIGTTKTLDVPKIDSYVVTFDATLGISTVTTLNSSRPFSSWTLTGGGTINGNVYTFASTDGTITANYTNGAITLPNAISNEYNFNGWYDAAIGGNKVGDAGASYTPTSNITLYAQWEVPTITVTLSAGANGKIFPSGTVAVSQNDSLEFYVVPNKGYKVQSILVDGVDIGTNEKNKLTGITQNMVVNVTFTAVTVADVNKPILSENMIPVRWDGENWVITSSGDSRWYNYDTSENRWANVMLRDGLKYINDSGVSTDVGTTALSTLIGKEVDSSYTGSLYVWIPRYSYKISEQTIDIKWSKGLTDYTLDDYILHPAFVYAGYNGGDTSTASNYSDGGVEVSGIWVAKYEAKKVNSLIRIIESGSAWTNTNIGTMFTTAKNMVGQQAYYLSSTYFDTHLMKNSEWGAISYLQEYTGISNNYDVKEIAPGSGYDEYVAAYQELMGGTVNYVVRMYGSSLMEAAAKYVDVVKLTKPYDDVRNFDSYKNYYGNAMGETSISGSGNTSFNAESSSIPMGSMPFVVRTGRFGYTGGSGISSSSIGFRTTIVPIQQPTISKYNVSVESLVNGGTITGINSYTSGSTVTLKVTPSSMYNFKGWSVISGGISIANSTSATISFTMPSNDVVVFANYSLKDAQKYILSANVNGLEELTIRNVGETITLTAEPANGSTFTGWTVFGVTVANTGSTTITFTMPANDVSVYANFST